MSKLKRRKTAVEEIKPEQQFRIKDQNESLRIPDAALHRRAEGSPAGRGSSCWTCSDLSDVEKLWMRTLQSLCPQVPAQDTALCVPQLPQLPHLSTREEKVHAQCWCSLDEVIIPFPNPAAPSPLPHSVPFPSSPVPIPEPQVRAGSVSLHSSPSSLGHRVGGSDVSEREQDGSRAAAGKSGSATEHSGPACEAEAGAGTLDTLEIKSRPVPGLGIKSGSEPGINNGAGMSGRGSGSDGFRLDCCPMCLTPFPAEFSQMDCDGHLAQCLSEMNVDVAW